MLPETLKVPFVKNPQSTTANQFEKSKPTGSLFLQKILFYPLDPHALLFSLTESFSFLILFSSYRKFLSSNLTSMDRQFLGNRYHYHPIKLIEEF